MEKLKIIRSWLFLAAIVLLAASQIFYLALSFSALQKMQMEASLKVESLLLDNLTDRLAVIVRTGRDLGRYPGLDKEVARILRLSRAEYFMVISASGQALGGRFPAEDLKVADLQIPDGALSQFQAGNLTWLGRVILDRDGQTAAYVLAAPHTAGGLEMLHRLFQEKYGLLGGITALSIILLALAMIFGAQKIRDRSIGRFKIYALFLGPFLIGQILFFSLIMVDISQNYREHNRQLAGQLSETLALDLEKLLNQNLALNSIPGLDEHLQSIGRRFPLAESIKVLDLAGRPAASAGLDDAGRPKREERRFLDLAVTRPLGSASGPAGTVEVVLSLSALRAGWLQLFLDNATMALVAGLL
ncbi:hypothetical protein LJB86_06280, partial [Deltaproteobacteria bacterium OttesenSCG-928-M10]|nr:hypothetical protein [Deltaproteobacteria bacterium OttesenSCG-928-M10]